jgi:hypothetical protein
LQATLDFEAVRGEEPTTTWVGTTSTAAKMEMMDRGENKLNRPLLAEQPQQKTPKSCEDSFWDCLFCTCCDEGYESRSTAGYTNRDGLNVTDFNVSDLNSSILSDEHDRQLKLTHSKLNVHTQKIKVEEKHVSQNQRTSLALEKSYAEAAPDRPPSNLQASDRPNPTDFSGAKHSANGFQNAGL